MGEVNFDIKPLDERLSRFSSGVIIPQRQNDEIFLKELDLRSYPNNNECRVISLEENALLRIHHNLNGSYGFLLENGNITRECFIYVPNEGFS